MAATNLKTLRPKLKRMLKSEDYQVCLLKLLLECWNAETPHFGGCGPHRYDGQSKTCSYCGRPKSWKPVNPGYVAGEVLHGED